MSNKLLVTSVVMITLPLTGCGQTATPTPVQNPLTISPSTSPMSTNQPTNQNISEPEFLSLYTTIRNTISNPTPDEFIAHVDTSSTEADKLAMFKANWNNQEAKSVWSHFIPDLTKMNRLGFKVDGDWAAYYFEGDPMDAEDTTDYQNVDINVLRMHKINNQWLLCLQMGASAIPKNADTTELQKAINNEINTSDLLTVKPKEE